jgi:hypothetical protein
LPEPPFCWSGARTCAGLTLIGQHQRGLFPKISFVRHPGVFLSTNFVVFVSGQVTTCGTVLFVQETVYMCIMNLFI